MLTTSLIKENERGYAINWQDFELKIKSAKMVLLCNPHNPTGTVWSEEDLFKIAASCAKQKSGYVQMKFTVILFLTMVSRPR